MTATTWTEQDSTDLSVQIVLDGHRLPLLGAERHAAVTAMVAAGLPCAVIAYRLRIAESTLTQWASRNRIRLPRKPAAHWSVGFVTPSATAAAQRVRRATKRTREGATPR